MQILIQSEKISKYKVFQLAQLVSNSNHPLKVLEEPLPANKKRITRRRLSKSSPLVGLVLGVFLIAFGAIMLSWWYDNFLLSSFAIGFAAVGLMPFFISLEIYWQSLKRGPFWLRDHNWNTRYATIWKEKTWKIIIGLFPWLLILFAVVVESVSSKGPFAELGFLRFVNAAIFGFVFLLLFAVLIAGLFANLSNLSQVTFYFDCFPFFLGQKFKGKIKIGRRFFSQIEKKSPFIDCTLICLEEAAIIDEETGIIREQDDIVNFHVVGIPKWQTTVSLKFAHRQTQINIDLPQKALSTHLQGDPPIRWQLQMKFPGDKEPFCVLLVPVYDKNLP